MNAPTGTPNVVRTGKSEIYSEIPDELIVAAAIDEKHHEIMRHIGFHSVMVMPLIAGGKILGVINFVTTTDSKRTYTDDDLRFAEDFARRVALTIENVQLFKEAKDVAERFSILTDFLPQIVWAAEPNGSHFYYNKHWFEYTGLTYDTSKDEGWSLVLHPDDSART